MKAVIVGAGGHAELLWAAWKASEDHAVDVAGSLETVRN